VVVFERVSLAFDDKVVLDEISFELLPGRMKIFLGASGAGKSTILRLLLGLLRPDGGKIFVLGKRVDDAREAELMDVRARLGMVFQEGALFDSLTVRENVGFRLFEGSDLPIPEVDRRVREVLGFVGLSDFGARMPSELSGGERRRVAIARAVASRPTILLYDEPTTGLDPITALSIDHEIIKLRDLERVSSIIVTHQLRDAFSIATHEGRVVDGVTQFTEASEETRDRTEFLMLKDGGLAFRGRAEALTASTDPYLRAFLAGTIAANGGRSPESVVADAFQGEREPPEVEVGAHGRSPGGSVATIGEGKSEPRKEV
jgi:phospholipid/cholesterol/gamma-HCH transport system ATP-binding protein